MEAMESSLSPVPCGNLKAKSPTKCINIQKTWHSIEHRKGSSDGVRAGTRPGFAFVGAWLGTGGLTTQIFHFFVRGTSDCKSTSSVDFGVTNKCRQANFQIRNL